MTLMLFLILSIFNVTNIQPPPTCINYKFYYDTPIIQPTNSQRFIFIFTPSRHTSQSYLWIQKSNPPVPENLVTFFWKLISVILSLFPNTSIDPLLVKSICRLRLQDSTLERDRTRYLFFLRRNNLNWFHPSPLYPSSQISVLKSLTLVFVWTWSHYFDLCTSTPS